MSAAPKIHEEPPCKAPDRTVPRGQENPIVFHIEVNPDTHEGVVSLTPSVVMFIKGDYVRFTSNSRKTAIRYVEYSPFRHPADVGDPFYVGHSSEPLPVARPRGSSHFDCGYIDEKTGEFEKWKGSGADGPGGY